MTKANYIPHIFALSVLFTLGNAIISPPEFGIINLVLTLIISLVVVCFFGRLKFCQNIIALVAAICGVTTTAIDYIQFLKQEQMSNTSIVLLVAVFGIVISFLGIIKPRAIYKYSLFAFLIVTVILALCLVAGRTNFEYTNLTESIKNTNVSLNKIFALCLPLVALSSFTSNENSRQKPLLFGVMTGVLLLFITMLQSVLTLGNVSNFPYLKAVSTISVGSLFTRLDGLVWFVFFVTSVIKTVVCVKVIESAFKRVKIKPSDIYKQKTL